MPAATKLISADVLDPIRQHHGGRHNAVVGPGRCKNGQGVGLGPFVGRPASSGEDRVTVTRER